MRIFKRHTELSNYLKSINKDNVTIGFVPTMGALHDGHLSLLEQSISENKVSVISIFVNPTQFNNAEDLKKYPRTLDSDIEKIKKFNTEILIFAPSVDDIYEGKTVAKHFNFDGLENQMEGKFRAGHFDGVGTIVKRLFEIINPHNAYFGEKDFQQLQIVKKMTEKEKLNVNIVGCPIHREANGLAMSSRNERLDVSQRKKAAVIYETLKKVKLKFGKESASRVTNWVEKQFASTDGFELEYFQIADEHTLLPFSRKLKGKKYRAFIAVFVNNVRLIDTISLN